MSFSSIRSNSIPTMSSSSINNEGPEPAEPKKLPVPINLANSYNPATTISSVASHQHQQEQEMLSNFAIPNPPISTQQSSAASVDHDLSASKNPEGGDSSSLIEPPRTLWMGDLDPWLDENAIKNLWWQILNKQVTVKIIKPKVSKPDINYLGLSHSGYCFVEFQTFDDAQQALSLNGQLLPDIAMPSQQSFPRNPDNQKKYFRLNWASGATLSAPIIQTPEYSLFVGDLSASTTEAHLLAFFQKKFPNSIKTVRVMTDPVSGKSRCFGFVRFTDDRERQQALVEMNGAWFGGRPLRVALATPRNNLNNNSNANSSPSSNSGYAGSPGYPIHPQQQSQPPNRGFFPDQGQFMPPPPGVGNSPYGYYGGHPPPPPPPLHPPLGDDSSFRPGSTGPFNEAPIGPGYMGPPPPGLSEDGSTYNPQPPLQQHFDPGSPAAMQQMGGNFGYNGAQAGQNPQQLYADPNNTTVFVGGLSSEVTEQTLFTLFKPFGIIQQVKIPPGKNCGFIKYSTREEAEEAISAMQGFIIGGNRIRLSWGRVSMNNKKYQQQQHQIAQAAQLQAAAALSMGMPPASAIAAAAAAAAAGYPPPPPQGSNYGPPMGIPPMGQPQPYSLVSPGAINSPYLTGSGGSNRGSLSQDNDDSFERHQPQQQPQPEVYGYPHEFGGYIGGANYGPPPHLQPDDFVSTMASLQLDEHQEQPPSAANRYPQLIQHTSSHHNSIGGESQGPEETSKSDEKVN